MKFRMEIWYILSLKFKYVTLGLNPNHKLRVGKSKTEVC
jgi:hypothetical protein